MTHFFAAVLTAALAAITAAVAAPAMACAFVETEGQIRLSEVCEAPTTGPWWNPMERLDMEVNDLSVQNEAAREAYVATRLAYRLTLSEASYAAYKAAVAAYEETLAQLSGALDRKEVRLNGREILQQASEVPRVEELSTFTRYPEVNVVQVMAAVANIDHAPVGPVNPRRYDGAN